MEYSQLRKEVIQYVEALQAKGLSYQSICDHINNQQADFRLFKDFFSRFKSKANYFRSSAKQKKLAIIHQHLHHFYHQNMDAADSMNDLFWKVISDASVVKFEAYLECNRPEKTYPSGLLAFYFKTSPAYLSIKNELLHRKQYRWELDVLNYGSTCKILSVETNNLFNQNAVVTTEEYWKLMWVDQYSRQLQFKFESLGPQTYLLSIDEQGQWKIIENMQQAQPNRIVPEYIDYSLLSQLASDSWAENRIVANNFLADNELLHCIEFIKYSFSDRLPGNQTSILERIRKSYLNSHRLLNTEAINFTVYQSEIEYLNKQLKLICDSIFLSNK